MFCVVRFPLFCWCAPGVITKSRRQTCQYRPRSPLPVGDRPDPARPVVTAAALDSVTKAKSPYRIALIVKTRSDPFFLPMIAEFEQTTKRLGASAEIRAPAKEKTNQPALVQEMTGQDVNAICIVPDDSAALIPALVAAQKKGIIVINLLDRVDTNTAKAQGLRFDGYIGSEKAPPPAVLPDGSAAPPPEPRPDAIGRYGARMAVGLLNGDIPKSGEVLIPREVARTN